LPSSYASIEAVDCVIELAWTVACLWQKKKKERDSRVEMSGSTFDPDK
jgi:hypothetical protein